MSAAPAQRIEMIPISRITVLNPRIRNRRNFKEIVDNIAELGLKRPITVSRRMEAGGPYYDLVCGQGRVEAFKSLGQREVPALVVNASEEDCLVASLVENCARRHHRAVDLLQDIAGMKERGYGVPEIARKTGLSGEYVYAVVRLLEKGEVRLLRAVEAGQIPFSIALQIAETDDVGGQAALQDAYEKHLLRGKKFHAIKRLVEVRRQQGRGLKNQARKTRPLSSAMLVKAYEEDSARKRLLIKRAESAKNRLMFVVEAMRRLVSDQDFLTILTEEKLDTMPRPLADRLAKSPRTRP